MILRSSALALAALGVACATSACSAEVASSSSATGSGVTANRDEAPSYSGEGFQGARILRLADSTWLTDRALDDALAAADVTVFGEQHQTAPIQALERWLLARQIARLPDLGLAMEHFQRDEQPVIDRYLAGEIDQATFEATAQVWPGYATYWRQVVEEAHTHRRPVLGLNVPKEALSGIYAQFPTWPLDAFNAIPQTAAGADSLPPRPLPGWDATYQGWFETSYDHASHGQAWGLSYADALHYFTDLAQIRDEAMAYWVSRGLAGSTHHLFVVAGDWHVQTRLALPDRVARLKPDAKIVTITTVPADHLDEVTDFEHAGRPAADYVIVYAPPAAPPPPPPPTE
jgi:uncharacterized iron-regulated protein